MNHPKSSVPSWQRRSSRAGALALAILGWLAVNRAKAAETPVALAKTYAATILGSKDLLGYWPLTDHVKKAAGTLELLPAKPTLTRSEGPFGESSVDLSDGNYLSVNANKDLEGPSLGVELLFSLAKPTEGNPCLFAIRSDKATRFSLHYNSGSNQVIVYNGSAVVRYTTNDELVLNEWFHIAASIDPDQIRIWLNGKECEPMGDAPGASPATGLPFVLGASNTQKGSEHADIKVAHLALYKKPLKEEEIVHHIKSVGWDRKMQQRFMWQKSPVSILESQIGYHPLNTKHVYLRSALETPPDGIFNEDFAVMDVSSDKEVFRGKVAKWGGKWDTFWWVLDFTPLRLSGEFYVTCGQLVSTPFKIEEGIFHKTDLDVIALDQLEHRIHLGVDDKRGGLKGVYVNAPPDTRIYMDCGSPYSELQPVGTCVYALFEMHDLLGQKYSAKDRQRMIDLAAMGADYFVAAQRSSENPEVDGMFYHSLLCNSNDTWAGNFSTYLDTAYGVALLAKSHQFFKTRDPKRAEQYIAAAKKAWELCTRRPYHTKLDKTFPNGCNAYFWNAPVGIQDTFGRSFYNILDKDWKMPETLRTRDRLPYIQGSATLYEITGDKKYLDKAIEFAGKVVERQFTDWENPVEDCFGTFYEFEGNDDAFFHEFMQGGFWWQGNVEALTLEGFMQLLKLAPHHSEAASWHNAISIYAESFARKATTLNPLGIYPVTIYKDPKHGGLKYFQNTLMGSSCLYGFSAKNFMMLGEFLHDSSFQSPALAGVNFIGGLNPGIPNAYNETAWDARTLIQGVGRSWFGPAGDLAETARGSVPNGFCAAPQFWQPTFDNFISYQTDAPRGLISKGGGLQFNEGWILHSHAYVHGVARLESPYKLTLKTVNVGIPVKASVEISLTETEAPHGASKHIYQIADDGSLTITDLPTPCRGIVRITYGNHEIVRPIAAIAGGNHQLSLDFAREVNVTIELPDKIAIGTAGEAKVTVENIGSEELNLKFAVSASGLQLGKDQVVLTVKQGSSQVVTVPYVGGTKVMPYMVRAVITEGAPERVFHGMGKISSK